MSTFCYIIILLLSISTSWLSHLPIGSDANSCEWVLNALVVRLYSKRTTSAYEIRMKTIISGVLSIDHWQNYRLPYSYNYDIHSVCKQLVYAVDIRVPSPMVYVHFCSNGIYGVVYLYICVNCILLRLRFSTCCLLSSLSYIVVVQLVSFFIRLARHTRTTQILCCHEWG